MRHGRPSAKLLPLMEAGTAVSWRVVFGKARSTTCGTMTCGSGRFLRCRRQNIDLFQSERRFIGRFISILLVRCGQLLARCLRLVFSPCNPNPSVFVPSKRKLGKLRHMRRGPYQFGQQPVPSAPGSDERGDVYQRATRRPQIAPSATRPVIAIEYQVATNSGESSVQWAA